MLRDRFLGGVSSLALFAPETGAGDGAGAGDAGAAAAAAAAAAKVPAGDDGGAVDPAKASAAAGTLAGGGADSPAAIAGAAAAAAVKGATPGALPEGFDFRAYLAKGDKAVEKDLAKYTDLGALYASHRELQAKISRGELKAPAAPLAKDATPEQKAEWRKSNGLPESAEAYVAKLALPNGQVIGEADKPLVAGFAKDMFEAGATQDEMNRAVNWFYKQQDAAKAERVAADGQFKVAAEVALRTEWGAGEYERNINAIGSVRALMPQDVMEGVFGARTPDGRLVGDVPAINKWLAQLGRELNPAATLVGQGGGDAGKSLAAEIASIDETYRKAIGGDAVAHRAYYGSDGKPGLEVRQRELIDAQQKMTARGKAA